MLLREQSRPMLFRLQNDANSNTTNRGCSSSHRCPTIPRVGGYTAHGGPRLRFRGTVVYATEIRFVGPLFQTPDLSSLWACRKGTLLPAARRQELRSPCRIHWAAASVPDESGLKLHRSRPSSFLGSAGRTSTWCGWRLRSYR